MARPKVFISSTYYDLKYIRASLENFVDSIGYDAVLSEKGKIAYTPDTPLDESCYREVNDSDILVLIMGGRYGSEKSETREEPKKEFYDRYDSITKEEINTALKNDVPVYILIERSVYSDYENYLLNKANSFNYAHVDSVNIFELIDKIISLPKNNPIFQFDKYEEIENWLKEQWAGLFRELLKRLKNQSQISSLTLEVENLSELNETLKKYLEKIIKKLDPAGSSKIIEEEDERLREIKEISRIESTNLGRTMIKTWGIKNEDIISITKKSGSLKEMMKELTKNSNDPVLLKELFRSSTSNKKSRIYNDTIENLNELRIALDLKPLIYD